MKSTVSKYGCDLPPTGCLIHSDLSPPTLTEGPKDFFSHSECSKPGRCLPSQQISLSPMTVIISITEGPFHRKHQNTSSRTYTRPLNHVTEHVAVARSIFFSSYFFFSGMSRDAGSLAGSGRPPIGSFFLLRFVENAFKWFSSDWEKASLGADYRCLNTPQD